MFIPTMISVAWFLHLAPVVVQEVHFQVVHDALSGPDIEFVHFESTQTDLELAVYSSDQRVATWPEPSTPSDRLAPNERFVMDPQHGALMIKSVKYACMDGTDPSGLARATQLRLPGGPPRPSLPGRPPLPEPGPPGPVAGACRVHFNGDASLFAFVRSTLEPGLPREVTLLRRRAPPETGWAPAVSYVLREPDAISLGHAELQMNDAGSLIAQRDGGALVLRDAAAREIRRLEAHGAFALSPDGTWLARSTPSQVIFDQLAADGVPTGLQTRFPTATRALEVRLFGARALVRERTAVTLVDVPGAKPRWTRAADEGRWASMDLIETASGRVLVGLGRLTVLAAPARRAGVPVAGQAHATIEVIDTANDQTLGETSLELSRWTHGVPWVRFAAPAAHLVVVTPQVALVSTRNH